MKTLLLPIKSMRERMLLWLFAGWLLLGFPDSLQAGDVYRGTALGDVVVAEIEKVHPGPHTYADPPRIDLKIVEVLRGDPKIKRNEAIMSPPFHGVDYGPGDDTDPTIRAWKKQKFTVPKVGEKWIYWGRLIAVEKEPGAKEPGAKNPVQKEPVQKEPLLKGDPQQAEPRLFSLSAYHSYPYSEQKRTWAMQEIRQAKLDQEKYAQEQAAEKARLEQQARDWRESFTEKRIQKLAAEAGVIVTGEITSGPAGGTQYDLLVSEWIKKSEIKGSLPQYVQILVSAQANDLIAPRRGKYVVFLPAKPNRMQPFWEFSVLEKGAAIVQLDEKVLALLKK